MVDISLICQSPACDRVKLATNKQKKGMENVLQLIGWFAGASKTKEDQNLLQNYFNYNYGKTANFKRIQVV